ncbi:MAG: hypothetical protein CLLPBCKN_007099 [Chroococcidiopsis cubana SAG 39.79]|nr:hypothetical protein [Chroococcidiopsis cubana SAG 39.79]
MLTVALQSMQRAFDTVVCLAVVGLDVIEDGVCLGNFF